DDFSPPGGAREGRSASVSGARSGDAALVAVRRRRNPQHVVDVAHAADALDQILGAPFLLARADSSGQRDFTVFHRDLHVGRIDKRILGEAIANVFADALVRTAIAARAFAAVILASALPPTPLAAAARAIAAIAKRAAAVIHFSSITAFAPRSAAFAARHPVLRVTAAG